MSRKMSRIPFSVVTEFVQSFNWKKLIGKV